MAGKGRPGPEAIPDRHAREAREKHLTTVLAERSNTIGNGYRGAWEVVEDWHGDAGHVGAFHHCHIRPCYDVVRGGQL